MLFCYYLRSVIVSAASIFFSLINKYIKLSECQENIFLQIIIKFGRAKLPR